MIDNQPQQGRCEQGDSGATALDPLTSHCHGCGMLRPLWELKLTTLAVTPVRVVKLVCRPDVEAPGQPGTAALTRIESVFSRVFIGPRRPPAGSWRLPPTAMERGIW